MKSEYPKAMYHPNFRPAVLSNAPAMDVPGGPRQGRAAQFPPVTVGGPDDEAWYVSRGYLVGHVTHPEPLPLRHKGRENIRMRQGPEPEPTETYEYPKWVGDKIAQSAEEEAEILAEQAKPPVAAITPPAGLADYAEFQEFLRWKAAQQPQNVALTKQYGERPPLSEEQKQRRRDNLARARAMRRQKLEASRAS